MEKIERKKSWKYSIVKLGILIQHLNPLILDVNLTR